MNNVEKFYESTVEKEKNRLTEDPYHSLEFITNMYYLNKYLPKRGYLLDLGCGPGSYAVALGKKGYDLALLDISKKLLDVAVKNMKKHKLTNKVKAVVHGSATNLSMFKNNTFDAVLCFGPLYHLTSAKDQKKVLREMIRVAKPNAKIFIAAISYYGVLRTVLITYPNELVLKSHKRVFKEGVLKKKRPGKGFPDAKFFKPEELKEFAEKQGLETIDIFANEGLSTHLKEATNKLYRNKKRWNKWIELIIKNSNKKSIVGLTEHFVLISRNKKK